MFTAFKGIQKSIHTTKSTEGLVKLTISCKIYLSGLNAVALLGT